MNVIRVWMTVLSLASVSGLAYADSYRNNDRFEHRYRGEDSRRHTQTQAVYTRPTPVSLNHMGISGALPQFYRPTYREHGHNRPIYTEQNVVYQPIGYQPRPVQLHRQHSWSRGQVLPVIYRQPQYYVDYRPYRLPPPPAGYGWVRLNQDAVLTAITTGIISSVVYNIFQ